MPIYFTFFFVVFFFFLTTFFFVVSFFLGGSTFSDLPQLDHNLLKNPIKSPFHVRHTDAPFIKSLKNNTFNLKKSLLFS